MKYRIQNGATRGKAFKVFGGIEIVEVGETKTIDVETELTREFIGAQARQGVVIGIAAEAPVTDNLEILSDGYVVVSPSRGWYAISHDGEIVTKSMRKADVEGFDGLSDADKASFVKANEV